MKRIREWELLEELGRGGMGVVWRARGPGGQEAAVKLLLDGQADPELLARFAREVRSLAELRHPGVVGIRGHGVEAGIPWVAMDYLPGGSLQGRLASEGPLHPEEAVRLALTLARTIDHVHGMGVLHRDLKPANVLLDGDGRPVVTDFGLAWRQAEQRLTRTGEILGSPGFMAPEQIDPRRGRPGRATDVYGLGATLHALLTGHPPFRGEPAAVLIAVLTRDPPRLSRAGAPFDPALEALVLRCLDKDPARRWSSAGDLAGALEAWLRTARRPARRRLPWAAAAGLMALGAGFLGTQRLLRERPPAPAPVAAPAPAPPARIAFDDPQVAAELAAEAEAAEAAWLQELPRFEDRLEPELRRQVEASIRGAASLEDARGRAQLDDPGARALALELLLERWDDPESSAERCRLLEGPLRDLSRALVEARRAATLLPDDPGAWSNLASVAAKGGRLQEALRALDRWRELDARPDPLAGDRFLRGRALSALGRAEEAVLELEAACQGPSPGSVSWATAFSSLVEHHTGTGQPELALRLADEGLRKLGGTEVGNGARHLHQQRGRALQRLGRGEEARAEFRRSAELARADGALEVEVLLYRMLAGEEAIAEQLEAHCAEVLAAAPRDGTFLALRAVVLDHLGRAGPAFDACRAALATDPSRDEPRFLLGLLLLERGEARQALAVYTRGLLAYDPGSPQTRAGRALALLALGQVEDARREMAALAGDETSPHVGLARCRLLLASGDAEGARRAADQALALLPSTFGGLARRLRAGRDG